MDEIYIEEVEDQLYVGPDELAQWLQSSQLVAVALDDSTGRTSPIPPYFWKGRLADEALKSGRVRLPVPGEDPIEGWVFITNASFEALTNTPERGEAPSPSAERPEWWPRKGEKLTPWIGRAAPFAERALRDSAASLTEASVSAEIEKMWRLAGLKCSDGSVARIRRRRHAQAK